MSVLIIVRDALLVVLVSAGVGMTVNALRHLGIPFIQRDEYQILVPCPETTGVIETISADRLSLDDGKALLVDARSRAEHQAWHPPGSLHVPYDYLEPTAPDLIRRIASSAAKRVVVYGDGRSPDPGEQLAKELSGRGIRNVVFIAGGAPALRRASARGGKP